MSRGKSGPCPRVGKGQGYARRGQMGIASSQVWRDLESLWGAVGLGVVEGSEEVVERTPAGMSEFVECRVRAVESEVL